MPAPLSPGRRRWRCRAPRAAVVIGAAIARPVLHAAETVLEVAAISAASVLGLAAAGGIAYVELRARNRQATDRQAMSQRALTIRRDCQAVSAPPRLAIEAPRRNFTDLRSLAAKQGYDVVRREDRED